MIPRAGSSFSVMGHMRRNEEAVRAVAMMKKTRMVDLTEEIALTAADLSLAHTRATASIIESAMDSLCITPADVYLKVDLEKATPMAASETSSASNSKSSKAGILTETGANSRGGQQVASVTCDEVPFVRLTVNSRLPS